MPTTTEIKVRIAQTAQQHGVSPLLALAVARAESGFNQAAVSAAGAIGIFQLMPATAADLGVDPYDWQQNIDGGVRYLAWLASKYPGRTEFMLAGYNWGVGNVNRVLNQSSSTVFPSPAIVQSFPLDRFMAALPAETRDYIPRVLNYMIQMQNDPVLLGLPGSQPSPVTPQIEITDADIRLIAGVVVAALLMFALLKR